MPDPTGEQNRAARPRLRLIEGDRQDSGRHALVAPAGGAPSEKLDPPIPQTNLRRRPLDEDALLTPIFAALSRRAGGRPAAADPVEPFRRDALTAPLPVVVPARRRPGAHARVEPLPERPAHGRHHLRRSPAWLPH